MNQPVYLSALGMVNALGCGVDEVTSRLLRGDTRGGELSNAWLPSGPTRVAAVRDACSPVLAMTSIPDWPADCSDYDCRNNRLLLTAVNQIRAEIEAEIGHFGRERIGIVLGTSTSGIAEGEAAIAGHRISGSLPAGFRYAQQELGSPAMFLARLLDIRGPAYCVSTACTSSAKAFVSARNLLQQGMCDTVLVGGVDSLCKLTVNGFAALESLSVDLCQPMSRNRKGINIGEAAALFIMRREESAFALLGAGESSDAYHISAPQPEGVGAEMAMRVALADARLPAEAIDYLNLHGTATAKNDAMESLAVSRVFPAGIAASGTKPMTGHTLGAAGATELGLCWLALRSGFLPPHIWDGEADADLPRLDLVTLGRKFERPSGRVCMSNSFAFGGSNACLLIGDAP